MTRFFLLLLLLSLVGCGGGNAPVNQGKDMPVQPPPPPKAKDAKDK